MSNLRRSARLHQAGVDSELWYEFNPGDRVLTQDGIFGRVTAVEDGPHPGNEHYLVELDHDLGGGEYTASELRHPDSDSVEDEFEKTALAPRNRENVLQQEVHRLVTKYGDAGYGLPLRDWKIVLYSTNASSARAVGHTNFADTELHLSEWGIQQMSEDEVIDTLRHEVAHVLAGPWAEHGREWRAWAVKVGADPSATSNHPPGTFRDPGYKWWGICPTHGQVAGWFRKPRNRFRHGCGQEVIVTDDWDEAYELGYTASKEAEYHLASDDYPELAEVLEERLPLPHSERLSSKEKGSEEYRKAYERGWRSRGGLDAADPNAPDKFPPRLSKEAGFFTDKVLSPAADYMIENQNPNTRYNPQTGEMASYDWCRFRRDRRCYYPKRLNEQATQQAGYAVWIPEDRGFCPRDSWDAQKQCPVGEPGPNSGDPRNLTDATVPWEQGGQRYDYRGRPVPVSIYSSKAKQCPQSNKTGRAPGERDQCMHCGKIVYTRVGDGKTEVHTLPKGWDKEAALKGSEYPCDRCGRDDVWVEVRSNWELLCDDCEVQRRKEEGKPPHPVVSMLSSPLSKDEEFRFHFTSAWRDVQQKAKRIRENGHVRVISSTPAYLVGEVRGDTNVYQTTLQRNVGTNKIAMWECGCAWAAYSWGRSGRWKKYEGRMCSHALALNYEGQSRGWGGQAIEEDVDLPKWRSDPSITVKVPGDYKRPDTGEWRVDAALEETWRVASTDPTLQLAPAVSVAKDLIYESGDRPDEVVATLMAFGVENPDDIIKEAAGDFEVQYKGAIFTVVEQLPNGNLILEDGREVSGDEVSHPNYSPSRGLVAARLANRTFRELTRGWHIKAHRLDGGVDEMVITTDLSHFTVGGRVYATLSDGSERSWSYEEWHDEYDDIELVAKGVKSINGQPVKFGSKTSGKLAQADSQDGCMIAFRPPDHILEALDQDVIEEDYDNLHVTIAYLGKAADIDIEGLRAAVAQWASQWPAFQGQLSGYGVFENDDSRVLVTMVDIPYLDEAREDLVDLMASVGAHPMRNHGFTPHMTLAYGDDVIAPEGMPDGAKGDFAFGNVYLVCGEDWEPFAFTGRIKQAELNDEPEPALPQTDGEDDAPDASHFMGEDTDESEFDEAPAAIVAEDPDLRGQEVPEEDIDKLQANLSHLAPGSSEGGDHSNKDIARAAREALKKMSLKEFSPEEQAELIGEGEREGTLASNLDKLDLTGTHYEALEEAFQEEEESMDDIWMGL